ncbi:hypothetical protein MTO96_012978 [Rhipicephalus appendiculatus]
MRLVSPYSMSVRAGTATETLRRTRGPTAKPRGPALPEKRMPETAALRTRGQPTEEHNVAHTQVCSLNSSRRSKTKEQCAVRAKHGQEQKQRDERAVRAQMQQADSPAEDPSGRHGRAAAGGRSHSTKSAVRQKYTPVHVTASPDGTPREKGGVRARLAAFQESAAAKRNRRRGAGSGSIRRTRARHL